MTKIDDTDFENKDLDWFLEDNPLNEILYENLYNINDSLNFEGIFNDAYKICIRVYSENHPELKYKTRFGLDEAAFFPDYYLYSWYCAITMLKLNDELRQKGNGDKNLSLFISKACQLLPQRGITVIFYNIIEDHFRYIFADNYLHYQEKKYDFLALLSKKEEKQQHEDSVVVKKSDKEIDIEKISLTCGPYEIAPKKKTAFMSVIWALKELGFFVKKADGSYATNRSDVINSFLTQKGNADQLLNKALKTDIFMNVFNDMLDKALEMYSKDDKKKVRQG